MSQLLKVNALLVSLVLGGAAVRADEHGPEHGRGPEEHRPDHANPPAPQHASPPAPQHANPPAAQHANPPAPQHASPSPPRRVAPPRWESHAPGPAPTGPAAHPHRVRVLAPKVLKFGKARTWRHWEHPEFERPQYYWSWGSIRSVTCIAEDSYGDQYPVTETTTRGFGFEQMTAVEDDALDRCYAESGGDESCYLASCSHL